MLPNHHTQKEGGKIGIAKKQKKKKKLKQNQNKMVLIHGERERANHGFIYLVVGIFGIF